MEISKRKLEKLNADLRDIESKWLNWENDKPTTDIIKIQESDDILIQEYFDKIISFWNEVLKK